MFIAVVVVLGLIVIVLLMVLQYIALGIDMPATMMMVPNPKTIEECHHQLAAKNHNDFLLRQLISANC